MMVRLLVALAIVVLRPLSALAQVENIGKGVDLGVHAASNIADQGGILGSIAIAVAILSLILHGCQGWAIVSLYKALQSLQDKRAEDAKAATRDVASASIAGTNAITASGERLADHSARLQTLAERTLELPGSIARLELTFKDLVEAFGKLGEKVEASMRGRGPA